MSSAGTRHSAKRPRESWVKNYTEQGQGQVALQTEAYFKSLWDDTTIASTGNGSVIIAPAMANEAFRQWFFQKVSTPLSSDPIEAQTYLVEFHDETKKRLKDLCGRTPHLKVNRVFCAIYPEHFTTIADEGAIRFLHRSMGGKNDHIVHIHHAIKKRIDGLLGPVAADDFSPEFCARLSLPWYLYETTTSELDPNQPSPQPRPSDALKPLPAVLRRKGLTAIKGNFSALLELLPELQEGLSRVELEDLIAQRNPGLLKASIGVNINRRGCRPRVVVHGHRTCAGDTQWHRLCTGIHVPA